MKKMKYTLLTLPLIFSLTFGQNVNLNVSKIEKYSDSYKMDARIFLEKHDKIVAEFHEANPNFVNEQKLKKTAWNFSVGAQKNWFAYNFEDNDYYTVSSTCRAIGTNCYIFVENSIWNSEVTQDNVNAIQNGFDNSTPANSNKGIYTTVVENFGSPPNIDGDPKIIILILDIKDGYNGSGGYIAGYFHSINQINVTNSNNAEIYYLDANPSNLSTEDGLNNVLSTTAHEFQHMVHYNYHNGSNSKPSQLTFLNEGCSLVAEVICGYPLYNQSLFNDEYNHYLFDWRSGDDVLSDYSRAAKYMTYMYGQFGTSYLKNFVSSNKVGIAGIDDALSNTQPSTSLRFTESLSNWLKANIINDNAYPQWRYSIPNVFNVSPYDHKNPNYTSTNRVVAQAAADYIMYSEGRNLEITFNDFGNNKLDFVSVKIKNNSILAVENLSPNTTLQFADFGIEYDIIIFGILNTDNSNTHLYNYSSSGSANSVELAYDLNPPTGYLPLSVSDTVCVIFDAVPGAFLDSIKVGLAGAGTIKGGVYRHTGETRPTPLAQKLVYPLTVSSNKQSSNPWSNWVTADLTDQNISTASSFVVAFEVEGSYPTFNQVMVTTQPTDNIHSYTYLNSPGSGSDPNWFYISSSETEAYAYLIRAYAGFGITGIEDQVVELLPSEITLEQNYPNPFNPSTNISFSLPHEDYVDLVIYNALGQKVETLLSKNLNEGSHSVNFNASNIVSGVYFYRLTSGSFSEIKKMILVK